MMNHAIKPLNDITAQKVKCHRDNQSLGQF